MTRKPPKCADCRAATMQVVVTGKREEFLCGSCEYRRAHPEAAAYVPPPRERRAKRLQSEVLFP